MKWPWQSEQAYRQAGTQKLAELIEAFAESKRQHQGKKAEAQHQKIRAMLSEPGAFNPNLPIETKKGLVDLCSLMLSADLATDVSLLLEAGFEPAWCADADFVARVMIKSEPATLKPIWDKLKAAHYDFSRLNREGECLIAIAMRYEKDEALAWLLEDVDIVSTPIHSLTFFNQFMRPGYDLVYHLTGRIEHYSEMLLPLMKQGLVELRHQTPTQWSPRELVEVAGPVLMLGELEKDNPAPKAQAFYEKYASDIRTFFAAPQTTPNPALNWQEDDIKAIYGCGLLVQALDTRFWQGHEAKLHALYVGLPEHIQWTMRRYDTDLLQLAEAKAATRIMGPVQHWEIGVSADAPAKGAAR